MVRNIEIGIRFGTIEDLIDKKKKDQRGINIESKLISKILSEERIRLLKEINGKDCISVISKRLDRRIEHVSRDLALLKRYGIIDFEKSGREKIPMMSEGKLTIRV